MKLRRVGSHLASFSLRWTRRLGWVTLAVTVGSFILIAADAILLSEDNNAYPEKGRED